MSDPASDSFPALKIPLTKCGSFLRKLAPHVHSDPKMPSIVLDKQKSTRLLLLNRNIGSKDLSGLPEDLRDWIKEQPDVSVTDFKVGGPAEGQKDQNAGKESEPLGGLLPKDVDSNIRKETLKNVIILSLLKEQAPYKKEIAKLLLAVFFSKMAFKHGNIIAGNRRGEVGCGQGR